MQKKVVNLETGTESLVDLTSEEIKEREELTKRVEQEEKDAFDQQPYNLKRLTEYGSAIDQIQFITEKGLDAWQTKVSEIKTKYPKPE